MNRIRLQGIGSLDFLNVSLKAAAFGRIISGSDIPEGISFPDLNAHARLHPVGASVSLILSELQKGNCEQNRADDCRKNQHSFHGNSF